MKNMKTKIINRLIAILLLAICYYTGNILGGAYDDVFNNLDVIAISTGLSSIFWVFYKMG